MTHFPDVSVCITCWNNETSIRRSMESASALGCREVVFCDCGSTDATLDILRSEYSHFPLLSSHQELSFAESRNLGLRHATGCYLLFMEADWTLDRPNLQVLKECLESAENTLLAVPRLLDADSSVQIGHNVRRFPSAGALCMEFLLLHKLLRSDPFTRHYRMLDFDHRQDRVVDHACGAVILAKRLPLLEAGGYDERFRPAWMEDVELSRRLTRLGFRSFFCSGAAARHIGRETTRHFIIENHYPDFYRGVLLYCRENMGRRWHLVRLSLTAGLIAKLIFTHIVPGSARRKALDHYRIYNPDSTIQTYRHLYWRTLTDVLLRPRL